MTQETLKEAKDFRRSTGIMAIVLWTFIPFFVYLSDSESIDTTVLISIGAIVLTFIYFKMNGLIKKYERISDGK
jgi:hypothetical protein